MRLGKNAIKIARAWGGGGRARARAHAAIAFTVNGSVFFFYFEATRGEENGGGAESGFAKCSLSGEFLSFPN